MDKQQHDPWDKRTFSKGANADIDPDELGRIPERYETSTNYRPVSVDGNTGGLEKIRGEQVAYPMAGIPFASTYICNGARVVNGDLVEFWTSPEVTAAPVIRVAGVIMAQSSLIPYDYQYPHQYLVAEDCKGGMILPLDNHSIPLWFNIQDIKDHFALNDGKYFQGFDPLQFSINAPSPNTRPRFYGWVDVGGGGGMFPGRSAWSIRYVNVAGDRTNIGPETPFADIPLSQGPHDATFSVPLNDAQGFPGASLVGGALADIGTRTRYGALLKFRVVNIGDYDRIEIIRTDINEGQGLLSIPKRFVVYQMPIAPGQIDNQPQQWIDRGDTIELIPETEAEVQRAFILTAKTGRYIEQRAALGNVSVAPREAPLVFDEPGGDRVFPFTKNLGIFGHADPVQNCYYKRFMGGEKYSLGIQTYDGSGGKGFVVPAVDNFLTPTRRERKGGLSDLNSDADLWATDTTNVVSKTFEAYDHDTAVPKQSLTEIVNIMIDGVQTLAQVNSVGPQPDLSPVAPQYLDNGNVKTKYTLPLHPTRYDDPDKSGHNYRVNTGVFPDPSNLSAPTPFLPAVWQPNIHTMGLAVTGITNIPDWVQGFSIVRKAPAKRVQCQGLVAYILQENPNGPAGKDQYRVKFFSPDIANGMVDQAFLQRLIDNPTSIGIEFVAPTGFTTELYGGATIPGYSNSHLCDMLSIARLQWDSGQINPGTGAAGFQPIGPGPIGSNYPGYGVWRDPNGPPVNNPWTNDPAQGKRIFTISSATLYTDDTGVQSYDLVLSGAQIYGTSLSDQSSIFGSAQTKAFHEPWYIANLVETGALCDPDAGYLSTGHYQAYRAIIGVGNGTESQQLVLVDERREDCVTDFSDQYRYVWVTAPGLPQRAWMCITGTAGLDINAINLDITNNGFWVSPDNIEVYGLYQADLSAQGETILRFGLYGPPSVLTSGAVVRSIYNNAAPLKCYGDCTVNPALFPMVDKIAWATDIDLNPQSITENAYTFPLNGCALPYGGYKYNPRYYVPLGGFVPTNPEGVSRPFTLRQWVALFDCESRAPIELNVFNDNDKSYPNIHYVKRPFFFDTTADLVTNGVFANYANFYPGEDAVWGHGGFKVSRIVNLDYAASRGIQFFRKPPFFRERLDGCNWVLYSEKVNTLDQDSPGLKTFPASNLYAIDDDTGEIKYMWSANSGTMGYNIWMLTERGVVMLPTSKSVAYSANGESFALTRQDAFLSSEIWRSKYTGCPGEFWRMIAEGSVPIGGDQYEDTLFWPDHKGVYRLSNGTIREIARGRYLSRILPVIGQGNLSRIQNMNAMWDAKHNLYWMGMKSGGTNRLFIYSADPQVNAWVSEYFYEFDYLLCDQMLLYGMRDLTTYQLDKGFIISGAPIDARVIYPVSGNSMKVEAVWMSVNSTSRPTEVNFYDKDRILRTTIAGTDLRDVDGYEQAVSRIDNANEDLRDRLQSEFIFVEIVHSDAVKNTIHSARLQIKELT